jgi:Zn-dependent protease with chaperone function
MIGAYYYDGHSSKRHEAALSLSNGHIYLTGEWGRREARFDEVQVSEPMGTAPRTVRFPDGAFCEVADTAKLAALLTAAGHKEALSVRLHQRWSMVLASLAVVIGVVIASYIWLLPAAANYLAPRIPAVFVEKLSQSALTSLDEHVLQPSTLPPQREVEVTRRMAAFAAAGGLPAYKLHFRSTAKGMPPNAFALPNGDIVIFDSLLDKLSDDEAIAVFAHELGHVAHDHGLRMLIQGTVVATVAAVYLGDISSLVAALSTAMLQSNYSQVFESEADRYAALALKRNGKSPMLLVSALEKLEAAAHERLNGGQSKPTKEPKKQPDEEENWFERTFSSHPSIARRSAALKALAD